MYRFEFPSFVVTSRTELSLLPYFAGNPPASSVTSDTASAMNGENSPNRCDGLYTVIPSSRIRFWSGLPPRMYSRFEKSEVAITPGSS